MSRYMSLVKYAADAYAGTAKEGPAARAEVLQQFAKSLGAEIEGMWYGAGEWDLIMVMKGELDAKALASQWAALGSGAFAMVQNFPVFEPEEFQAGFDGDLGTYRAPGATS
ncbi:MAG: GYD domain-containing protein [Acidimicrobiales bacterium]